jgi:predicted RND superfamily exporter protein
LFYYIFAIQKVQGEFPGMKRTTGELMDKLFRRPGLVIGVITVITVFFVLQLPKAETDNNNLQFIPKDNPARITANYIEETFGNSVMILAGLERPFGTVFEPAFLELIRNYTETIELVPFVKDVNSIMSTQYITGNSEEIIVSDLVPEDFTGTAEEIVELKRRIASWDIFKGTLVSDNLSATQILVSLDAKQDDVGTPEVSASLFAVRDTAWEMFAGLANVYVTGTPVINVTINEAMKTDIMVLVPLVVLVVLAVLFFSFRRFTFVILPLITVIVAVIWTIGAMPLFGIKLTVISTVLPIILIAVGSAYGIHVVTHYMEDTKNKILNVDEHREFVLALTKKMWKPVFLAALTTFAGFISFLFTPIVPMKEFGIFSSLGVMVSFIVALTLIPSLLLLRGKRTPKPHPPKPKRPAAGDNKISNALGNGLLEAVRKKYLVLAITVLIIGISIYGLSKIVVDNAVIEFFQNDTDISRSDRFIREYFGGSKELTLVVEADTPQELLSPEVLGAVDGLGTYLSERVPAVGNVVGFTDTIKRMNQVFNTDESPEGLSLKTGAGPAGETDDFGFGDFDDDETSVSVPQATASIGSAAPYSLEQYSAADLIALFDSAAGTSTRMSGTDIVRELKRLVNYEGAAYYEIPVNPKRYGKTRPEELQQLVSNYLVLLAGDDDSEYSNDPFEPTAIKTIIQLRTIGDKDTNAIIDIINTYIMHNFPETVRVMIGGGAIQEGAVTDLIVNSQIISLVVSVLVVFVIIALSNRSFVAGIIAAAPLAIAILGNFAVMGFFGIKLNIGTALIASLAVGIGIDYTIHFIEFFKHEYTADHSDGMGFLHRTFVSSGKAILINALSVGAGFGVLAFSQFRILAELGSLVALNMVITALVSLTIIPVLLTLIKPKFIYHTEGSK